MLDIIVVALTLIPMLYFLLLRDTHYWRTLGNQIEHPSVLTKDRELDSESQPFIRGKILKNLF